MQTGLLALSVLSDRLDRAMQALGVEVLNVDCAEPAKNL
jgi:hypothetical protein